MHYPSFIDSLQQDKPGDIDPCLKALWHEARGDWHAAHEIVQSLNSSMAARIHAYLHRKEGDEWNSKYWHRVAGSRLPQHLSLEEEWQMLVKALLNSTE